MKTAIVWFRQDLRLQDNHALFHANQECDEIIPVFIADKDSQSISNLGRASQVWLHHSLKNLGDNLAKLGSPLIFSHGDALDELNKLCNEVNATHVYWNRCYEPEIRKRDEKIKATLKQNLTVKSYTGNVLVEPWENVKQDGTPYRVFTPFWKSLLQKPFIPKPLDTLHSLKSTAKSPKSLSLDELNFLPPEFIPKWDETMIKYWQVGEDAAHDALADFMTERVNSYKDKRDFPAIDGTSRLSPHLHFGEISPRQIFHFGEMHKAQQPEDDYGVEQILRQVVWREFAYSLLYYFPQTVTQPLFEKFESFKWQDDVEKLERWQKGQTGFPIIDAGMRELWDTGYMHNRVRMIAASFLCKNLLIHWHAGEAWFRDTLVDADLANNVMGWQWVAGSGADAAPYFRIFNPILQSKKFDPQGEYIRRWVPELSELDNKQIHEPNDDIAIECGYPLPIVDLKATRERALERYAEIK